MTSTRKAPTQVTINVELFGNARLLAGRKLVRLSVADDCGLGDIAEGIGQQHPALVGTVVREDLTGFLESYTVNLSGMEFIDEPRRRLSDGESLLVFSSQAGG
ncbi:MAG: MoaD/ThiS family protein [Dehalococcoidia bacterium]|nr:MoaD/ThiS family protein [Dehalococcoidia bacterium]